MKAASPLLIRVKELQRQYFFHLTAIYIVKECTNLSNRFFRFFELFTELTMHCFDFTYIIKSNMKLPQFTKAWVLSRKHLGSSFLYVILKGLCQAWHKSIT